MEDDDISLADTVGEAEQLASVMAELEARSQRFGNALTGALRSAAVGGKGLEDVLRGLGNRLSDIALSAALKPLEGALGNAIGGLVGSVVPFAEGGVARTPSFFPMGGGGDIGLMGEAGAEAILPLKRGPDGTLGVAGGGGAGPQIVFNVTATDAASFRKSEGQIAAMLARSVGRGQRSR